MNPFIELARDPVGTLALSGYAVLLVGILGVGTVHAVRTIVEVYQDWLQNRERDKWARLWGEGIGYIPPFIVALRLLWGLTVLAVALWSIGALIWLLGG